MLPARIEGAIFESSPILLNCLTGNAPNDSNSLLFPSLNDAGHVSRGIVEVSDQWAVRIVRAHVIHGKLPKYTKPLVQEAGGKVPLPTQRLSLRLSYLVASIYLLH